MFSTVVKIFKTSLFCVLAGLMCGCYYLYPHDDPLPDSYFRNNNTSQKQPENQQYQHPVYSNQNPPQNQNPAPNQYYIPANQMNYQQQYGYQPVYYPYQYYQGGSTIYTNPYIIPQPILQRMPQIQDQDQYYKIPNSTQYFDTNR